MYRKHKILPGRCARLTWNTSNNPTVKHVCVPLTCIFTVQSKYWCTFYKGERKRGVKNGEFFTAVQYQNEDISESWFRYKYIIHAWSVTS